MSKEINRVIWIGSMKKTEQSSVLICNNTICSYYMPGPVLQVFTDITSVSPEK